MFRLLLAKFYAGRASFGNQTKSILDPNTLDPESVAKLYSTIMTKRMLNGILSRDQKQLQKVLKRLMASNLRIPNLSM
jgi:hypothetical protein